jgi:serine protease Do
MSKENELIELLDRFNKNSLSEAERIDLENRLVSDADARRIAAEHGIFVAALKSFGDRVAVKKMLDHVHMEIEEETVANLNLKKQSMLRKYWPVIAVAASLAAFAIVSILLMQSIEQQNDIEYQEVRANVEKIRKSQNKIMAEIKENAKPEIPPGKYSGTGFFISAAGFLATSYHVVKGADSVYIENEKYGRRKVSVVFTDPKRDVAILEMEDKMILPRSLPYLITNGEAGLGEEVYTLGYPRNDIVFGAGSVSALSGYRQDAGAYQISVPVNPGNSGGPLFNVEGDLVGIISGVQTKTAGAAFAVKSSMLHEVLAEFPSDSLGKKIVLPVRNALKHQRRVEQVKRWREFVFMVSVYNKD